MNFERELNDKQYEAVTAKDQYLRIIAGAGSGKTRVLTYRIAYLVGVLGVFPQEIMAITFTNKVANEMKERVMKLLPDVSLSSLQISTFHSFCAKVLRREISVLGFPSNFVIFDDDDQEKLVKTIAVDFGYKKGDSEVKDALNYIGYQKMLGKLPQDINENELKHSDRVKFDFFVEYEKRKNESFCLDFDDLLIYTIKIFENYDDVLRKYQNRFKHILVDEFQDTNDTQFKLLRLLTTSYNSLYVVGDPDQTIYTWRGANHRIILDIDKLYSPLRTIILNQNYRSTKPILDVANCLINNNKERMKKDLFTEIESREKVDLFSFVDGGHEAEFVAKTIMDIKNHNVDCRFNDFAILYRSSSSSLKFENALVSRRIPYRIYGGVKFYGRKEVKDALAYFRLFINPRDNVSFERIYNVPRRGFGESSFEIFKKEAKELNLPYMEYLYKLKDLDSELKPVLKAKLIELAEEMTKVTNKLSENLEAYSEVLEAFLRKIGYLQYLVDEDEDKEDESVKNVRELIDDVRNYLKTHEDSNFEEYLQNITLLTSQDEIDGSDRVNLMTVHTAKGLEFKYVFVVNFSDGSFPNSRAIMDGREKSLEEERRLAYVAFTRAKNKLYITYNSGFNYTSNGNNTPSRFIKEANLHYTPTENNNFVGIERRGSMNIYQYNFDKNNKGTGYTPRTPAPRTNVFEVSGGNGIKWSVGDTAIHKIFGEGKVISVNGDIIEVDFTSCGRKKLLGSHKTLSKKD